MLGKISIHALREEGDERPRRAILSGHYFYPRPPRGGRPEDAHGNYMTEQISIHALREEGDVQLAAGPHFRGISIHALREEGDVKADDPEQRGGIFLSTPSARRATAGAYGVIVEGIFLSTPSARRATQAIAEDDGEWEISIHALREEGDANGMPCRIVYGDFYPRPPRGGRREAIRSRTLGKGISIHALREEGDQVQVPQTAGPRDFYPRPPRGGRQLSPSTTTDFQQFLSTPSARWATEAVASAAASHLFLSTPSARRATRRMR